jgi:hypothetical protein
MAIFRQYIAPLIVVLVFLLALVAVSARIFLPTDMAAPAPIEEVDQIAQLLPETPTAIAKVDSTTPTLAPTSAPQAEPQPTEPIAQTPAQLPAEPDSSTPNEVAGLPPNLETLVKGLPAAPGMGTQL